VTRITVAAAFDGVRLDRFLASQPGVETRTVAERLITAGVVTVDGEHPAKSHRLHTGAKVVIGELAAEVVEHRPAPDVPVVYEDDRLLVVDKPAGLITHGAPGITEPTLVDALRGRAGGGPADRAGIVHRLDRDTSGLLVVARDEITLLKLQAMLRRRRISRIYSALVRGRPPSRTGRIEAPIGRDRRQPTRMSVETDFPREAATRFELVEPLSDRSLLRVQLETGRTHQIRVHLEAIGHPVVGDPLYGHGPELGLDRQFLHASELAFVHPWTAEPVAMTSPLPADLTAALELAREA
jgi:23S rRNA pseudouridine1911/1915/1917 synthase